MADDATTEAAPDLDQDAKGTLPYLTRVPGGIPDTEATLREAAEAVVGEEPLALRLTPELYFAKRGRLSHTWVRWSGVRWQLKLTEEQAITLTEDLNRFFQDWVRKQQGEQEGR